jgi:NADH-ubiquinone oxidoreductase chain 6
MTNSLLLINETFTNGYRAEALDLISLASIFSGVFVIVSKNPIVSVLFLIGLFLSIACYLLVLGINFIGLSYLLVYVGAVSILFLFILMLINVRISELLSYTSNSIPLALLILVSFNYFVHEILPIDLSSFNMKYVSGYITFYEFIKYINGFFNLSIGDSSEKMFVTSKI